MLFGEVESRSSKALPKKLLGKHSYIILELTIKCTCLISDVQNECDTAKSLVVLEYALFARSTKVKKKIIYYHDQV